MDDNNFYIDVVWSSRGVEKRPILNPKSTQRSNITK